MPATPPQSPCINVCVLDGDGFCIGCLRTGDEIGRWRDMGADEQWRLLERLAERRQQRTAHQQTGQQRTESGGTNER